MPALRSIYLPESLEPSARCIEPLQLVGTAVITVVFIVWMEADVDVVSC